MKPKLMLRIVALLTLFVAVGQTISHFTRRVADDPAGAAVIHHMEQYKFSIGGTTRSWDDFYDGFSLELALVMFIFTAVFTLLAGIAKKHPKICYNMLWPYLLCYTGFTIVGFADFFAVPAISTLLCCILMVMTMVQLRRSHKLIVTDDAA
jgi:hypothetical protein